jgi:hypothetical protein
VNKDVKVETMNAISHSPHVRIVVHPAWTWCIAMALLFTQGAWAAQVCDFSLNGCPENFQNRTIVVPTYVTSMSPSVRVCEPQYVFENVTRSNPSIVIVIDNSGSMRRATGLEPAHDQWGYRYTVTMQLLDSIYRLAPHSEVSLVVFSNLLNFDPTSPEYYSTYFKRLPTTTDSTPNQGYLQLLKLDSLYVDRFHPAGKRGIDIIRDVLTVDTAGSGSSRYVDLSYKPQSFTPNDFTNINVAFDATRASLASTANPRQNQFVIFLSDGEPEGPQQAGRAANDFINGTNMATTFTVFFTSSTIGPANIQTMTQNIQNNSYSSSNPTSNLWTSVSQRDTLMNLLMKNVVAPILTLTRGVPSSIRINGLSPDFSADSVFVFGHRFPLQQDSSYFAFNITYHVRNTSTGREYDTLINVNFSVKRTDAMAQSSDVSLICRDTSYYTVTVSATTPAASQHGDIGRFTFHRDSSGGALTVHFTKTGTAQPGVDYQNFPDSVVFANGQANATVDVIPVFSTITAPSKTAILTLSDETSYKAGTPKADTVTIYADIVTVTSNPSSISENGGTANFAVSRTYPVGTTVVYFALTGTALADTDYTPNVKDSVILTNGQTTADIAIHAIRDYINEPDETVVLTIASSRSGSSLKYSVGAPGSAVITIKNYTAPFTIVPQASNNPVRMGSAPVPPFIAALPGINNGSLPVGPDGQIQGMVVAVEPKSTDPKDTLTKENMVLTGILSIYDVVGTMVIKDKAMVFDPITKRLYFVWDGRNSDGRSAAAGTYLGVMAINDNKGMKRIEKIRLGVKR